MTQILLAENLEFAATKQILSKPPLLLRRFDDKIYIFVLCILLLKFKSHFAEKTPNYFVIIR